MSNMNLQEVLATTPIRETFDGCAGSSEEFLLVTAILRDGSRKELEYRDVARYTSHLVNPYADNTPDQYGPEVSSVAGQIKGLDVVALEVHEFRDCSWDSNSSDRKYVVPVDLDYGKIRRRVEDRLRKAGDDLSLKVAIGLGVKIH
jgi:hypothetical protein